MRIRQNPLWLWNPEKTSPEIQNRDTSAPKIGHVNVFNKKTKKKKKKILEMQLFSFELQVQEERFK